MKPTPTPSQRFTWRRLILFLLIQLAVIGALEFYWRWQSGKWEATSLAVIPVVMWVYAAFAYRWLEIMKELANGSFSDDEYRANPMGYMMGNSRQHRRVIIIGAVIGLISIIVISVRG